MVSLALSCPSYVIIIMSIMICSLTLTDLNVQLSFHVFANTCHVMSVAVNFRLRVISLKIVENCTSLCIVASYGR